MVPSGGPLIALEPKRADPGCLSRGSRPIFDFVTMYVIRRIDQRGLLLAALVAVFATYGYVGIARCSRSAASTSIGR